MEGRTRGEYTFLAQHEPTLAKALYRRLLIRVFGPMTLGVLAVLALLAQAEVLATMAALSGGGVSLCLMVYLVSFQLPRQILQQNAHQLGRPVAYRIDGAGIRTTPDFGTDMLRWSAITGVARARGQIIIWQGWRTASSIPSGGLSHAEQDWLLDVLHTRGRALAARDSPN